MMRLTWVAFLMLMLGCVGAAERLTVRGACFRVRCPDDPGSATLLLHNPGAQPVQIDQVLMDASPLPVFGVREGLQAPQKDGDEALASAGRIYWARLDPNPIPPGRSGLLYVQFRTRPPYAFGLRLNCGAAPAAACKLFPIDNPVRITNIAFPRDCRKCLVHVENASRSTTERLKAVELNDADVTAQAWISSRDLPPGAHVLIVISSPALKPASFARVLLSFDSGRAVAEEVRALPVFPIALEHGGPAPELGITEAVREYPTDLALDAPPPPAVCCLRIFSCPAHAKGNDWQGVAAEALRRRAEAQKSLPSSATFLATCRARAELACPAFAHIADFGHLNPFLPQYSRSTPPQPLDAIFRAMAMLRAAKPISNHSGWLRTVVLRKAIEQAEQRAKLPRSQVSAALGGLAQPGDGESNALADRMDLDDVLAQLPAEQRVAFRLKFMQGLTYREIAAVLQCSLDTVCTRIRKAHRTLHEKLGGSQSDDPRPPEA